MGIHQSNLFCLCNSCTTLTPRTSHALLLLRQLNLEKKKFLLNTSVHIRVSRNPATETSSSHSGLFVLLRNEATSTVLTASFSTSPFLPSPFPSHFIHLPSFPSSLPFHSSILPSTFPVSSLTLLHLHKTMHLFQPLPRVISWETGKSEHDVVG